MVFLENLLYAAFRYLPFWVTKTVFGLTNNGKIREIACKSLRNRDIEIIEGVGRGLRIKIGSSNSDYALGKNELPVQKAFLNYVKLNDVVYDIGANIGFFTIIAAKLVGPGGHVYAFEPISENINKLRHNININKFLNVTVFEKAVSKSSGKEKIFLTKNSGGHTLSSGGVPKNKIGEIMIDIVSIDEMVEDLKINPPDIVKIDVEGAEYNVIDGMNKTIKKFRPLFIYEVDDFDEKLLKNKLDLIEALFKRHNYDIRYLENSYEGIQCHVKHGIAKPKK